MTDPAAPPSSPDAALHELVSMARDQSVEVAALDSPRAEAWASDLLALAAESTDPDDPTEALIGALSVIDDDLSATALCALRAFVPHVEEPTWSGPAPVWVGAIGSSVCEGAWLLETRAGRSAALRFVDAADVRHVLTVDLVDGPPETIGEVLVGSGDVLDAVHEEDADIDVTETDPVEIATRIAEALRATDRPSESAVANGRLLVARLSALCEVRCEPPVRVVEDRREVPPRAPDLDAYALDVLRRALGPVEADEVDTDAAAIVAVAAVVAPSDLSPFDPAAQDAILALEWADWLGAVIGLVRAGAGTVVDGESIVDLVNRCPEVDSTIPKADRARIAWAFDTVIEDWSDLGILEDGRLTELGTQLLPSALRAAWAPPAA